MENQEEKRDGIRMLLGNFVEDVRREFVSLFLDQKFLTDGVGLKFLEIQAANFIADEPNIFGGDLSDKRVHFPGGLVYSYENNWYRNIYNELKEDPNSRRAIMFFTNTELYLDTNSVQYLIRDGKVHCVVQMSNCDCCANYHKEWTFQKYTLNLLADDLHLDSGLLHWQISSLYLRERDFPYIKSYMDANK